MSWWCAAQGSIWEWSWQPFVGVWVMVAVLVVARLTAVKLLEPPDSERDSGALPVYLAGVFVLWLAADWPIGPLGKTSTRRGTFRLTEIQSSTVGRLRPAAWHMAGT